MCKSFIDLIESYMAHSLACVEHNDSVVSMAVQLVYTAHVIVSYSTAVSSITIDCATCKSSSNFLW